MSSFGMTSTLVSTKLGSGPPRSPRPEPAPWRVPSDPSLRRLILAPKSGSRFSCSLRWANSSSTGWGKSWMTWTRCTRPPYGVEPWGMIAYIILLAVLGLVVGGLGRLALPGPDPMSIWATMGIGIAASLIAGLLTYAVTGRNGAPFLVSVIVATGLVYLVRRSRGQTAWNTRR